MCMCGASACACEVCSGGWVWVGGGGGAAHSARNRTCCTCLAWCLVCLHELSGWCGQAICMVRQVRRLAGASRRPPSLRSCTAAHINQAHVPSGPLPCPFSDTASHPSLLPAQSTCSGGCWWAWASPLRWAPLRWCPRRSCSRRPPSRSSSTSYPCCGSRRGRGAGAGELLGLGSWG